jgi:hypothetical protein
MTILKEEIITDIEYKITTVQDSEGSIYIVKDLYEGRKLIDSHILSKDGWMIEDPVVLEEIENFLNDLTVII